VPGGYVFVDGARVGDIGPTVMHDREALGRDGFLIAVVALNDAGEVIDRPEIITRGFVYVKESEEIIQGVQDAILRAVNDDGQAGRNASALRDELERLLSTYIYNQIRRRPMVFVILTPAQRGQEMGVGNGEQGAGSVEREAGSGELPVSIS
jgi:ribonuclease J